MFPNLYSEFDRVAEISRMFAQSKQDMFDGNMIQNPLKVRPCFVRVLRDKDLDDHIKRYKKNDTEVNRYNFIHVSSNAFFAH